MARKSWSNLFLSMAAVDLVLAVVPSNPLRPAGWIALPMLIVFGTYLRRRMI